MTEENQNRSVGIPNTLLQVMPHITGLKHPEVKYGVMQLSLGPEFEPFGTFDIWNVFALLTLVDPNKPDAPIKTTYSNILSLLQFTQQVKDAGEGYLGYYAKDFQMVKASLDRLFQVSGISLTTNWKDKHKGTRTYRDKRERHFRILIDYTIHTREEVTPAALLTPKERAERARLQAAGEWKEPKPTSIEYRFHPDLAKDFQGGIGLTIMPVLKTLQLRKKFGRSRTATLLLFYVRRQLRPKDKNDEAAPTRISTSLEKLCRALNLDADRPGRTSHDLINSLKLLKEAAVILDFTLGGQPEDRLNRRLTITTNPDWPGRMTAPTPAPLPATKPAKKAKGLGNAGKPKKPAIP